MICSICSSESRYFFTGIILVNIEISYWKCPCCGFVQTDDPYWLNEAYTDAISALDIGLVSRNISLSRTVKRIITTSFDVTKEYIDFAGGYGLLVRLMRDFGLDFYWYDEYCENLFAKHWVRDFSKCENQFELITAFEVLEHLTDPIKTLREIFKRSDSLLFSTELTDGKTEEDFKKWSYLAAETGQHISFYSTENLKVTAEILGCNFYSDGSFIHILSKRKFKKDPFKSKFSFLQKKADSIIKKWERNSLHINSLTNKDYQTALEKAVKARTE